MTKRKESGADDFAHLTRTLFDSYVNHACISGDAENFEELLQWSSLAAWAAASGQGWFGEISSRDLETQLLRAAAQLPVPPDERKSPHSRPRWLHVFTEAYASYGHTNLCRRWIQCDPTVTHDVMILRPTGSAPQNLVEAAKSTGGQCVVLDPFTPLLQRAAELRNFAWANSDVVVLHTHSDEILGVVAFGIPGGPVVLVENQADHSFWAGCAVADLVLEIRRSGQLWTKQLRGVERSTILPIPLVEQRETTSGNERLRVRKALGLPENAVMLLTVGSALKYEPMLGLDFLATVKEILQACPQAYLVAVGPEAKGIWRAAQQETGGRILPVGYQPDSTVFCRAADLYLEGLPVGSLTALLEAGQAGLMCVRAPLEVPLPFCSDSLSLDSIPQPESLKDYIRTAVKLVNDPQARRDGGSRLQQDINAQHCGAGWVARLREIKAQLPQVHEVRLDFTPRPARAELRDWFFKYTYRNSPAPTRIEVATRIFTEAWSRVDAQPKLDAGLWLKLKAVEVRENPKGISATTSLGVVERYKLWRFNRKISSLGGRQRFMVRANVAFHSGNMKLARRMTYRCLWTSPTCWLDAQWLKQFVKVHLSPRWVERWRVSAARSKRQFVY